MITIAFALANYVARPLNYRLDWGWGQGVQATSSYFQPVESFAERFSDYLRDVRDLGFDAIDLWQAILDQVWVTDVHLDAAARLLNDFGIKPVGFAGDLGSTHDAFKTNCEICTALSIPLLVGTTSLGANDRGFVADTLKKYGLKWAYENEAELTVNEILRNAGEDGDGSIGICADTGWFGTHGVDAVAMLRQLAPRLFHVHLKDVRERGKHNTCRYEQGVVPLEACVRVLQEVGYDGTLVVEHEAETFDPTDDIRVSRSLLAGWLNPN